MSTGQGVIMPPLQSQTLLQHSPQIQQIQIQQPIQTIQQQQPIVSFNGKLLVIVHI